MPVPAPPDDLWTDLDPHLPVALLPVRLETRYGTRTETAADGTAVELPVLRVRIYPDTLTVSTTAPGLRPAELAAARAFWAAFDATDDEGARRSAWEVFVRHVGLERAPLVAAGGRDPAATATEGADVPAATATLLPDAWVLSGSLRGQRVVSGLVPSVRPSLQVGPTRGGQAFDPADPLLVTPEDGLRWVTDLAAAEEAGMAATLDLATVDQARSGDLPAAAREGLDSLVVLGVRVPAQGRTAADEASAIVDLLTATAERDRVAFVPQGTPTNNLQGRPSGWSRSADLFAAYERVVGAGAAAPGGPPQVDALRGGADVATTLAAALGLPAGALAGLDGAGSTEQQVARAATRALFPVTVGEVLATLLRPTRSEGEAFEQLLSRLDVLVPFVSEHMASFVRGRGTLPALRVGRQPYGVLPVLPLQRWARQDDEDAPLGQLVDVLELLRPFWDHAAAAVPTLDGTGTDTDATERLVRILGLSPVPHPGAYVVRTVTGSLATSLFSVGRPVFDLGDDALLDAAAVRSAVSDEVRLRGYRALLARTLPGLVDGSILEAMQLQGGASLRIPVATTDPGRAGWETPAGYLRALCRRLARFRLADPAPDERRADDLLFQLVQRALALSGELDTLRFLDLAAKDAAVVALATSPELLHSGLSVASTAVSALTAPLATLRTGSDTALPDAVVRLDATSIVADDALRADALSALNLPRQHLDGFAGTRDAVLALADADLSDAEYTRLVGETLACAATRLDAWMTSVAASRLATLRTARPDGLTVGAWGVLLDVRPGQPSPAEAPAGWDPARGPLVAPARQVGYVHAPSLAQARTAGVLRAGELAHGREDSSIATLDLTSARVRIARDVLEAVRNGQPLGAVLGYRLERALTDAGLQTAIAPLRAAFPQRRTSGAPGEPVAGDDAVVPGEVVDGLDVVRAGGAAAAVAGVAADRLAPILADLDRAAEAVADLLVADGVHSITSGRPETAGATFTALAEGNQPPLDLDVVREPRAGLTVQHRLVLGLGAAAGTAGWQRAQPRAVLAPEVELWLEDLLGPTAAWQLPVTGTDAAGVAGTVTVDVSTLACCALDVVVEAGTVVDGVPALAGRLTAAAGLRDGGPDGEAWARLTALAGAAYDVLRRARALLPADVRAPLPDDGTGTVPAAAPPDATALAPLADRMATLLEGLDTACAAAASAVVAGTEPDPGLLTTFTPFALRGSLVAPGTVPAGAVRTAAADAAGLLVDVDRTVDRTVAFAVSQGLVPAAAGDRRGRLAQLCVLPTALPTLTDLARRIGGAAVVPVVPVASDAAGSKVAVGEDELERWLNDVGRVRAAVAAYDDLRLFTEALGTAPQALVASQLPLIPGESWIGGPLPDSTSENPLRRWSRPGGPRTNVILAGDPGSDTLSGIVVDDYSEVLPESTATTGLAAHYDAPNSRPPQTILLAVHPDPRTAWSWPLLEETVHEAIALARMRLVELDDLSDTAIDEYLPLTYVRDGVANAKPFLALIRPDLPWTLEAIAANRYSGSA